MASQNKIEVINVDTLTTIDKPKATLLNYLTYCCCTHLYVSHIRYKVYLREASGSILTLYVRVESNIKIA